jgi:PAS domain-containing protein
MNAQLWLELCLALATAAGLLGGWWLARPSDHAQARQRLAQALEDVNVPVSVRDREDRLIACNEPFRAAYSEVAKLLQPGVTYAVMRNQFETALRARRSTGWLCVRVADDKSAPTWLMFRARPMRQPGGTFAGYHCWVRDLSAMEQALATTRSNESGLQCPEGRHMG